MQFHAIMKGPFGSFNVTVEAESYEAAEALLDSQYDESYPLAIETAADTQARESAVWASLNINA